MKIIYVSSITPASENIGGTSALPYHLMLRREADVEVVLYSFNCNGLSAEKIREVECELHVEIRIMPVPKVFRRLANGGAVGLAARTLMAYPMHYYLRLSSRYVEEIRSLRPDGVWVYGEELVGISCQLYDMPQVQTGPDCEALYYHRLLQRGWLGSEKKLRCMVMQRKYKRLAANASDCAVHHVVGEEDRNYFRSLNPKADVTFMRHPHYDYCENRIISFYEPKIRLLLAGRNDLYMQGYAKRLIDALASSNLADRFSFTFLGKGWEKETEEMLKTGWQCRHLAFVEDYGKELARYDVQLVPISIGTGTKGKVLDAFANGLLVIGTWFALENIAVRPGEDCLQYESADEVVAMLGDIAGNRKKYEDMAEKGRAAVLKYHDRATASKQLFGRFR